MWCHFRDLRFSRATLIPDAMAGLTVALVSIPDLERVGLAELVGRSSIFLSTLRLGESTTRALAAAEAWIARPGGGQTLEIDT